MVRERVGAPVRSADGARLNAIARVRETETGGWALRLWVIDDEGTHRRDVEDESCVLLAEAAATMVAVFVEPEVEAEAEPEPEPEPEAEPEPEVKPQSEPSRRPPGSDVPRPTPPTAVHPFTGQIRLAGQGGFGLLPAGFGGAEVGGTLGWSGLRVDVRGRGLFTSPARVSSGGSVRLQSWGAGLAAGWAMGRGRVQFPLLAGIDAGALRGRGDGLSVERRGAVGWATANLRPAVTVRWGRRVGVWASLEGFVSLLRPAVTLDDGTRVFGMPRGGGSISLGIVFFFGADTDSPPVRQPRLESP